MKLNLEKQNFRLFGPDETASNRLEAVYEVSGKVWMADIEDVDIDLSRRRPRHGGAERASVRRLARRLPAHRAPWPVLLLRGLHPHRRFDAQPAREVAEGQPEHSLAQAHRVAQLPADVACLAAGSQWLFPSGSRLHRSRRQQEVRRRAHLPAARRELPAVGRRPLPAQPQLHQRDRRRQAAGVAVARHRLGRPPLHRRRRHLALGEQRRRRSRRGHGLRRRCADARDAGRGDPPAQPMFPTSASGSSTWST